MTAWPLNCSAASAAEDVLWRRYGPAAHPLLTDTPAVPLRSSGEPARPVPTASMIGREAAIDLVRRTAQMLITREFRAR